MIANNYYHNSINEADYYFVKQQCENTFKQNKFSEGDQNIKIRNIRKDFPILERKINGYNLVWLDNAATTQKPLCVTESLNRYYKEYNSNVHRGAHTLAKEATEEYESARKKVQKFIGSSSPEEIIFLRGATEAINLVANTYGNMIINGQDEILVSQMEHHSNIVPWQMLCHKKGSRIVPIPINDKGEIILEEYEKLFSPRTKMVAITQVSNVLGTINPIREIVAIAHSHGVCVLVDGAQAAPHLSTDVRELDADFYTLSGHKMYGPTGIGVLYGKKALLDSMPPWQGGGGMIKDVDFDKTVYMDLPYKFEAGTGNIADAVALGTAVDYIEEIGMNNIECHEQELTKYAMEALSAIKGSYTIGNAYNKTSVLSFILDGVSPQKMAELLDSEGIAVRAGHHCAQPVLKHFGLSSTLRASIGLYNTYEDIDALVKGIIKHRYKS
ncbi:cysteine desulfurase [Pseudobacteroides cellulosolvens]|nr:cysteine desulfurase [Pseudobacteroides cellulosolvens]